MQSVLDEMKDWVRYTAADGERLRALYPLVEPHVPKIIDRFYAAIDAHDGARAVMEGPEQIERLKATLRRWLAEVFLGPHDAAYADRRRAIGWRHVQVGLPDRYMFTAMHVIRDGVCEVLRHQVDEPWEASDSFHRVLTMDLALMTGTYVEAREFKQFDTLQALLVEHLRVVVLLVSDEGLVHAATKATAQLLLDSDGTGKPWDEALPAALVQAANLRAHVDRALERHREVTLPRVDVEGRSFRVHIVPLRHELAAFLLQVEELTDAVEMEARLRRSESLAQLGALSAAVAHELRNPLAGISGALQVITRSMESDSLHHDILTKVDGEVRRLNGLVTDLLAFARPGTAKVQRTPLRPLVEEVVAMVMMEHPEARLEIHGKSDAQADPHLVRQVLHNLLRNAVDAVDGTGQVRVDIEPASVTVCDSGPGIPEEMRAEIFEPFVTTKTRGTGLGLAISMRSAQAMGGDLRLVEGELPGAGFRLVLQPAS